MIVMGAGRRAESASSMPEELPDDVLGGYRDRVEQCRQAWADDASLTRMLEVPWGQAPAATVLAGSMDDGRTIGVQIAGRRFADELVMAAGAWFEAAADLELPTRSVGV